MMKHIILSILKNYLLLNLQKIILSKENKEKKHLDFIFFQIFLNIQLEVRRHFFLFY